MTATATPATATSLDEEVSPTRSRPGRRLSQQSVVKHFDAYADIAWDDPSSHRPRRPALGAAGRRPARRHRLVPVAAARDAGPHRAPQDRANMKIGLQFENILKRGLLEYAFGLPDGSPEFRYAYHEVIEEAQHSLMFQEFVNRPGSTPPGLSWDLKLGSRPVIRMARRFPALFFVFVLGGEDPIDHVQRTVLRSGRDLHPLLERIMRIHVTEEARHLSFARQYLRHNVPKLGRGDGVAIAIEAPIILATMAA